MTLPCDKTARKRMPIATGALAYFPDAIAAVAHCSVIGNEQHAPGEPLHWVREKSTDHTDTIVRHLVDHMTADPIDSDGVPHIVKVAWRALAEAQLFLEAQQAKPDRRAEAQEIVNRVNAEAGVRGRSSEENAEPLCQSCSFKLRDCACNTNNEVLRVSENMAQALRGVFINGGSRP